MKTSLSRIICAIAFLTFASAIASSAQTFTQLFSFNQTDGAEPLAALIQGTNGNFYGTASAYGPSKMQYGGTVFEITSAGKLVGISGFCGGDTCPVGAVSEAPLLQTADGNFFGTNIGNYIFEISASGKLTSVYNFDSCSLNPCTDGSVPTAGLVQGHNGNLFGTTSAGGTASGLSCQTGGCGTLFEVTETGKLTTLYNFCSQANCTDGAMPLALILGTNGNFYGTTAHGGAYQNGTFFAINPAGELVTLHQFQQSEGVLPNAVMQGADGNFYGTTTSGGPNNGGTVFRVTPSGVLTTLYSFCALKNCTDGLGSSAALIQATDGNFYGTTLYGGAHGGGSVFEITPAGQLTTLYSFCPKYSCTDGQGPAAALVQGTDGAFYGTTIEGGKGGWGTVFKISTELGPFVAANPEFGKVGYRTNIIGNNLTGTTSVTVNGTLATFTAISSTHIEATVPEGATTGAIEVTTPTGTLSSNAAFQVLP